MAGVTTENVTLLAPIGNCDPNEKLWWVFLLSGVFTLVGGLFLVLFGKLVVRIHKKVSHRHSNPTKKVGDLKSDANRSKEKEKEEAEKQGDIGWVTSAKDWAGELISGQTTSGRILVSNAFGSYTYCLLLIVCIKHFHASALIDI